MDQQITFFVNNCVPEYVPEDLAWYERDSRVTYIDQLNVKSLFPTLTPPSKIQKLLTLKWYRPNVEVRLVRTLTNSIKA